MGRSVPVVLPNGKSWKNKGDAKDHFKDMLSRHAVGVRIVDDEDHNDLVALLTVYDSVLPAGEPSKVGAGIAYFEKRMDTDHPGRTFCFFVVRRDGTSIDFSYIRALDVAGKQP